MQKEVYFSVSEFGSICNVARKTLIYYDNIGLFRPALVKSNGYRYYTLQQIETLNIICMLSELGMPLEEIKQHLHRRSPLAARQMLARQEKLIESEIERLYGIQEMLRMRLQLTKEGVSASKGFRVIVQAEIPLYLSEPFRCDVRELPNEMQSQFYETCKQHLIPLTYPTCYLIKKDDLKSGNYHMVSHLCCHLEGRKKANGFMPAGRYLVGYGNYHYGDAFPLYQKMRKYAEKNHLKVGGNAYEEYLLDELSVSDSDLFKVKVSVQLEEKGDISV